MSLIEFSNQRLEDKTILQWKSNILTTCLDQTWNSPSLFSKENSLRSFLNTYPSRQFYCDNQLLQKSLKTISNKHHMRLRAAEQSFISCTQFHCRCQPHWCNQVRHIAQIVSPLAPRLQLAENRQDLRSADRREPVLYLSAPPTFVTPGFAGLWKLDRLVSLPKNALNLS